MNIINKIKEYLLRISEIYILILSLFVLSAAMIYFFKPLCAGIDFYVHYNRFIILMNSLSDGSFPIYMDYETINGYGYIIKLFYSDFMMIPFALIGYLINDPVLAYNLINIVLTFCCGLFTYASVTRITGNKFSGIFAAILYAFSLYKLEIWYLKGGLGEMIAMSFLPLVILGAYEIIYGKKERWYILTIAVSCVIFSHVISSVLTFITLFIFFIICNKHFRKDKKRIYYLFIAAISTVLITAYYTFPMLEQMLSNSFYYQTNKLIKEIVSLKVPLSMNSLFNITYVKNQNIINHIGSILFFTLLVRVFISNKTRNIKIADLFAITGIIYFFATTSFFPWHIFPFKYFLTMQFSWRLYPFIVLLFSIAGSIYVMDLIYTKIRKIFITSCLVSIYILIMYTNSIFYTERICNNQDQEIKVSKDYFSMIGAEYLPSKIPKKFMDFFEKRGQVVIPSDEFTIISNFHKDKGHITFDVSVADKDNLELPLTYYIGYKATLNGESIEYRQSEHGLIELPVHKPGAVEVIYTGTTLQKVSCYITLISIALFISYIIFVKTRNKKQLKRKV